MDAKPSNNIYLKLELFLDPAVTDFDGLKKELAQKITEWNKLTNVPNSKYKHMVQVAEAFNKRTEEPGPPNESADQSLPTQAKQARDWREKEGKKSAGIYEGDGILCQSEVDDLVREFSPYFRKKTIESWFSLKVEPAFVPPKEPVYPKGVKEKITPKAEMDSIAKELQIVLGNEDANLYDLLQLTPKTDLETLKKTQKEFHDKAIRKPKSGPESAKVDAEISVLGKAKTIFGDEISRQGYDIAKKRRPFDKLVNSTFRKRCHMGSITHKEYLQSIEEARKTGFSSEEAEWHVYEYYCKRRKLKPPVRVVQLPPRTQCPVCYTLNDVNAAHCSSCGVTLKIKCPRCDKKGSFGDKACTGCGSFFGNMPNAISRLEKAKQAIEQKNIEEAEEHLRYVSLYWDTVPGVDVVRKSLSELKMEHEKVREQIHNLESKIRAAIGERLFFEAERLFIELRRLPNTTRHLQKEETDVNQRLGDARKNLRELTSLVKDQEKIELCESILSQVADCVEAKTALEKFPPLPPINLSASVIPTGVELKWEPSEPNRPRSYIIVRKIGGAPASVNDGEKLSTGQSNTRFTDSKCEVGVVYGYSVFTQRDKTIESVGCKSRCVQRIENVGNIKILPGDSSLTVSWAKQPGCIGVSVQRFEGMRAGENGVAIPSQLANSFVDSNLKNGSIYSYRIRSIFKGIDGKPTFSTGIEVFGKPQVPPKAVDDLRFQELDDLTTDFHWTPPEHGEVLLFDLADDPEIPVGEATFTTVAALKNRFGDSIPVLRKGQTNWKNTSTGVRYLLPVTIFEGLATFGKIVPIIKIAEVNDLDTQFGGTKLRLTWTWPKGLRKVAVLYRYDRSPEGANDSQAAKMLVTPEEYAIENALVFPVGETQNYYFLVCSAVEHNSSNVYSKGKRIQTAKSLIKYDVCIRRKFIFWGPVEANIILQAAPTSTGFPEFVVKRDAKRPPMNREYGVPLFDIPAQQGRKLILPIAPHYLDEDSYIRIFVKNQTESDYYFIDQPPRENLRLICRRPSIPQLFRLFISTLFGKKN